MTTITTLEIARLNAAEAIAELAHFGQKDQQGRPRIFHVRSVARRCFNLEAEQRLAAILHDVVEDGGPQYYPAIWHLFGNEVTDLVKVLTRTAEEGYDYDTYISRVLSVPAAIPIKLADLDDHLDSSRDVNMDDETRRKIESLRERYRKARARLRSRLTELAVNG